MARQTAKTTGRKSVRLTIDIPVELDVRLYGTAKGQGCGKAELAARLVDQGLRRFDADRRIRAELKLARDEGEGEGEGTGEAA